MSTDVRRWTIVNVRDCFDELGRPKFCSVLDGPGTRPPEDSGLIGLDWVDAAKVETLAVDDVRAAIDELRADRSSRPASGESKFRAGECYGWHDALDALAARLGLEGDIERTGSDG